MMCQPLEVVGHASRRHHLFRFSNLLAMSTDVASHSAAWSYVCIMEHISDCLLRSVAEQEIDGLMYCGLCCSRGGRAAGRLEAL
jgi:hypothetical protein